MFVLDAVQRIVELVALVHLDDVHDARPLIGSAHMPYLTEGGSRGDDDDDKLADGRKRDDRFVRHHSRSRTSAKAGSETS